MSAKSISLDAGQPMLTISSKIGTKPWAGKKRVVTPLFEEGECREEIVWGIRSFLQDVVSSAIPVAGGASWERERVQTADITLDEPSLKQGGQTTLAIIPDYYNGFDEIGGACVRPCCAGVRSKIMDTLVGNLGLVLDTDPYYGDWWQAPAGQKNRLHEFKYYGVNNSCLHHPALLHITLGMFRQAHLLFTSGMDMGLLEAVPYDNTKKALNNADWKQAWKNLEAARRWIEVDPLAGTLSHWPFPVGYWDRLKALHTALYKYGVDEVFQASSVAERWGIRSGVDVEMYNSQSDIHGAWSYFGQGKKLTKAGRRLFKLGK